MPSVAPAITSAHARPYATAATRTDADVSLVCLAGSVKHDRVLITGPDGLEIMCHLLRRGATEVQLLRTGCRPEEEAVDLVIATAVDSMEALMPIVRHARSTLTATSRIILRVTADPAHLLGHSIAALLRLEGFSGVRIRPSSKGLLITGSLPWFGPISLAHHAG